VLRRLVIMAVLAALAVGCATQSGQVVARRSAPARDPRTAAALLKTAAAFNNAYDSGD